MNRRKWIQRALLSIAILVLAATIAVFIGYRRMTNTPDALLDLVKNQADMQLKKIHQTAMRNGIQEWRLEAESATLREEEKTVVLTKPEVEFLMDDGDNVHLTADSGTITTDSNRLQVSGQVTATTQLYRFKTERLDYDPATRELLSNTPVTLSGESFSLQANRMSMNLKTKVTQFEGGVEGTINEDFQL